MIKKSIHKKVFRAILGISLAFGVAICAVALLQLFSQKVRISRINQGYAEELTGETKEQLNSLNEEVAFSLASVYANIINDNFVSVRTLAQSTANYMGSLYDAGRYYKNQTGQSMDDSVAGEQEADGKAIANGQDMPGEEPDLFVGYMEGASPSAQEGELLRVGEIRRYIRTLKQYDPDNQDVLDIYVVTETGMCLDGAGKKYEGVYPELRDTEWYTGAKKSHGPYWAKAFTGVATGIRKITCGVPFYDEEGSCRGVAAVDLAIPSIYETALSVRSGQVEHALLLDDTGEIMINPDRYSLEGTDITEGIHITGDGFLSFTTIPETNWVLCMAFQFDLVEKTTENIGRIIENNTKELGALTDRYVTRSILLFLVIMAAGSLAVFFISRRISRGLVAPVNRLTREVAVIGAGNLSHRIRDVDTGDEIGLLAEAFNDMTVKLKEYIENLAAVTADKERIATELHVATQIQASMLPSIFPAFPERQEFDIYATMEPAKEVGGDFYDFFLVDERHLGIVIADVSGKGVPAALFMVIAKTLIKNHAQAMESPEDIFTGVNRQLCENNEAGLFVTAWMGVLDLDDGKLTYVNAGHNPPLVRRKDSDFAYLKSRAAFVLAGMEEVKYRQSELALSAGDMLYLYTDGVTEATDINDELFGEERLLESLNEKKDEKLAGVLAGIREDIDIFTKGAPQFDDMTMLVIRIKE